MGWFTIALLPNTAAGCGLSVAVISPGPALVEKKQSTCPGYRDSSCDMDQLAGTDTPLMSPRSLLYAAVLPGSVNPGTLTDAMESHCQSCSETGRPVWLSWTTSVQATVSWLTTLMFRNWPCIGPRPKMIVPLLVLAPSGTCHRSSWMTLLPVMSTFFHSSWNVTNGIVDPAPAVPMIEMS